VSVSDADLVDQVQDDGRADRAAEIVETPKVTQAVLDAVSRLGAQGVFHEYQKRAVALSHQVELLVVEKSRRVGITWAFAGDDVITSATARGQGGDDTLYISYSQDMAREYIDACAGFAKAFMGIDARVGEFMFDDEVPGQDETKQIKAFRIDFASGFSIQALSSAPRSLRGKQGRVRIDEGAFVNSLEELVKAAMALVMLGGSVVIMSSHNGVDSDFNKIIQRIRAGEQEGQVLTITFQDAIADGMYERIAKIRGLELTVEARDAWVAKIYKLYGAHASEELDCIPSKGTGSWLTFDEIERAEDPAVKVLRLAFEDAFTFQPDHLRQAAIREWCEAVLLPEILKLTAHDVLGVGGDFARITDLSVVWPLIEAQDRSLRTPFVIEMRNVPFTEQEFVWKFLLNRLRRWRAAIDAQGNGLYLAERLVQAFGSRVAALTSMNAAWWREHGPPVKQRFQDDRLSIPRDSDIAADLRAVKVEGGVPTIPKARTTAKGEDAALAKAGAKRHADAAVALVSAVFAIRQGVAGEIDHQSAGSVLPAQNLIAEDRGFGVVTSELTLNGY
jgi:phage FluMu gp28-like protein